MQYDLQAIGIDLRELWRGNPRITPRYVLTLVGQLSDGSALAASIRGGPEFRSWTLANSLAAAQANLLYAANQQRAGKKSIKTLIPPPKKAAKKQVVTVAELVALRKARKTQTE